MVVVMVRPKIGRGWLRSDGRPNFSNAVHEKPKELEYLIQKPVYSVSLRSPIIRGIDTMISRGVRRLPVTGSRNELKGIVTATDIVNFLGGGDYYNIVKSKHGGRFFSAIYEPVESIMCKDVISVCIDDSFSAVLEKMILENVGAVPVVDKEGTLLGIITEYDMMKYLSERTLTERVRDYMSPNPVSASPKLPIISAARLMISNGFRRIPLVDKELVGIVTTVDILRYIGEGAAFRRLLLDEMEQVLSVPVSEIMRTNPTTVEGDLPLGDVASRLRASGVNAVLVTDKGSLVGIFTERDLLTALAVE